jgi:hypothetical protein
MSQPLLIDLYCGAGGASDGYHRAGFEVIGVDIDPQPLYPFEFIQADALSDVPWMSLYRWRFLAAVHASPPCQRFSDLAHRNGNANDWPDLIEPTRQLLKATGLPYVIENVEGAPLMDPVTLCGTMFPETAVIRHRLFETNWPLVAPAHPKHPLSARSDAVTIPKDSISFNDDGTEAWLVIPLLLDVEMKLTEDRPCGTCDGNGWLRAPRAILSGGPDCEDCDGTGRHTFTIEVKTPGGFKRQSGLQGTGWSGGTRSYRVSVIPGMVLAIYGSDHEHYDSQWIEIHADGTAHRYWWDGVRNAHTSEPITLPPAAASGQWAVKLKVHRE